MRASSWLTGVYAFALACAVLALAPRAAYAQAVPSIGGIVGAVQRLEPDGVTSADNSNEHPHPNGVLVNDINFEDCQADLEYEFELTISGVNSSYNLNAWAGSQDCSVLANRQSATAVCWPVALPILAATNPFTIKLRMQDIVSQIFESSHAVTYVPANQNVCQLQTTTGATNLSLYFFFTDAESNPVGTNQPYPITVDLRAGDVQGSISAGVGDTLLIVNVPATTDPDTQEWNVYCDPPPGEEGALETVPVDAASNNGVCTSSSGGTTSDESGVATVVDSSVEDGAITDSSTTVTTPVTLDDAGGNACGVSLNDAQIPSPGGCSTSSVLVPGGSSSTGLVEEVDDAGNTIFVEAGTDELLEEGGVAVSGGTMKLIPGKYLCGSSSATSTQINVLHLKNGYYYNLSVAAVDALGNIGPLSNVVCGEPVPVNDFWKVYYEAGGRAGGGFCSTEGIGTPAGTSGLGALTLASIVAIARRRRRK
jgi:MYXO-CTERM domain-containing protein